MVNIKYIFFISLSMVLIHWSPVYNQVFNDSSYFPIDIGLQWTYSNGDYSITFTFADTQKIREHLYYGMSENDYPPHLWFRKDTNKVYLIVDDYWEPDSTEYLIYDFSIGSGESWTSACGSCDYCGEMTMAEKDVAIDSFENCYKIERFAPCADYGRNIEYLAPGIGLVSFGQVAIWGQDWFELVSASRISLTPDQNNFKTVKCFHLTQNYPNPFNPSTKISYSILQPAFVTLKVFNILGHEIQTLVEQFQITGDYQVNFDAKNLASGIYFYKIQVSGSLKNPGPNFTETKKMILTH